MGKMLCKKKEIGKAQKKQFKAEMTTENSFFTYSEEDFQKSYLEKCLPSQHALSEHNANLECHITDEIKNTMRHHAFESVDRICNIADGILPYDLNDLSSINNKEFANTIHELAQLGKALMKIQSVMKRVQSKKEHTIDSYGLERVFAGIDYRQNPLVYRIMGSVLETLPPNRDMKIAVNDMLDEFSNFMCRTRKINYQFMDVAERDLHRLKMVVYVKEKSMVIERMIEKSFFSKIDRIIHNIYNHFMELGYDINGANLGPIGWKVVFSRRR